MSEKNRTHLGHYFISSVVMKGIDGMCVSFDYR